MGGLGKRFGSALAVSLLCCSLARPAVAEPSAAEKETARGLVRDGRAKVRRGDLEGALSDFEAAHEIMGVPTTGLELGKAQAKAGMLVEALDTLLSVTRIAKAKREPRAFANARSEAKSLAEKLSARVPSVRVKLTGDAAEGSRVAIDGKELAAELVGAPYKLNPGVHDVVASGDGVEQRAQVELSEGEAREVVLNLVTPRAEPTPPPDAEAGGDETHPLVWAGVALALAGTVVGSVTGGLALKKHADVAPRCPNNQCPPDTHDELDQGRTLGTVSTAMFVVAGVGAAATIVGLFLPFGGDDGSSQDDAWLMLGPSGIRFGGRM